MLYKVVIGETGSLAKDNWFLTAPSFLSAAKKAEKQRKANDEYVKGWIVISLEEAGEVRG